MEEEPAVEAVKDPLSLPPLPTPPLPSHSKTPSHRHQPPLGGQLSASTWVLAPTREWGRGERDEGIVPPCLRSEHRRPVISPSEISQRRDPASYLLATPSIATAIGGSTPSASYQTLLQDLLPWRSLPFKAQHSLFPAPSHCESAETYMIFKFYRHLSLIGWAELSGHPSGAVKL